MENPFSVKLTDPVKRIQIHGLHSVLCRSTPFPIKATKMSKSRSFLAPRRAMSLLCRAGVVLAFSFFASCQTTSSTEVSRTGEKSIELEVADSALVPDHAFAMFSGGDQKPVGINPGAGTRVSFTVDLDKALGADEKVFLNLVSHGMVTTVVACVLNSNGELERTSGIERDTMARSIVRRLDGTTYPKSDVGAIQAYADALLKKEPLFQPYPQTFPKGLDTAKVRIEALRRAAKLAKPLEQLVGEWGLPLSYQNARTQILALVPPIPSSDSAILFPPPHVRVQQELASLGDLGAGGDAVGIVGSIASDIALASVDIDILDANGVVASDKFAIRCSQPKGTVLWDLAKDGQVSIKAVSALPGTYTIQIVGRDIQGRSTYLTLEITVKVTGSVDDQGPTIRMVSPTSDTSVESTVATFDVSVSATDPSGVDSVVIGKGSASKDADGNWHRSVVLDTTGAATAVEIAAFDHVGNISRQTVRITRKAPPGVVVPVIRILEPTSLKDLVLPFETATMLVKWTVSDKSGIADDGQTITGGTPTLVSDSTWQATVQIPATGKPVDIVIAVRNKSGKSASESFSVTRKTDAVPPDNSKPSLTLVSPGAKSGQVLNVDSNSVLVRWKVVDVFGVAPDAVLIDGVVAKKEADSIWSQRVPLAPTGAVRTIPVSVTNIKGTNVLDTVSIAREKDSIRPKILRLAANVSEAPFATTSVDIGWTVTDNHKLASVAINGQPATSVKGGDYASTIGLAVGENKVVLLAKDSMGNERRDTVVVSRAKDQVAPVATLLTGLQKSISLDYSVTSKKIGWTISDNHKMGTVLINKAAATQVGNEYSITLSNIELGTTKVFLEAGDSAGNVTYDTVVITRSLGASPVLTFSHAEGTHDSVLHVSIASNVADAVVKYTIDGTDPSATNGLTYTLGGTILVSQSRTIKVVATATGHEPGGILSRTYTLKADPPVFSVASGTTTDSIFTVKLTSPTAGATFYYTTDGSAPIVGVSASTTTGIDVDSIRTLKVVASKAGWSSSDVVTGKFNANIPIMVYVGEGGSKVVRADGSLWTTGAAASLADGSVNDRSSFEKILEGVKSVSNGLILKTTGDVFSYGGRYGSTTTSMNPVASGMVKISAGAEPSAMLVDSKGGLYALGQNDAGQLCTGDLVEVQAPKLVASGVKDVGAACTSARGSPYCRSIYVTNAGSAYGCGRDIGVTQKDAAMPTQIPGVGYSSVSVFGDFFQGSWVSRSSLLKSTGELMNLVPTTSGPVWTSVRTGVVKAIGAGNALYSLENYGWLYFLGAGGSPATDWTEVSNQIRDFATDGATNLYIKSNGALWASGYNGGRYGDGTTDDAASMKRVHLPN